MGILERGGKVRTKVVADRKKKTLQTEVKKHVEAGSALYSDALLPYDGYLIAFSASGDRPRRKFVAATSHQWLVELLATADRK